MKAAARQVLPTTGSLVSPPRVQYSEFTISNHNLRMLELPTNSDWKTWSQSNFLVCLPLFSAKHHVPQLTLPKQCRSSILRLLCIRLQRGLHLLQLRLLICSLRLHSNPPPHLLPSHSRWWQLLPYPNRENCNRNPFRNIHPFDPIRRRQQHNTYLPTLSGALLEKEIHTHWRHRRRCDWRHCLDRFLGLLVVVFHAQE